MQNHPWDIKKIEGSNEALSAKCPQILNRLLNTSPEDQLAFLKDTRPTHKELFEDFTLPGFPDLAGNYRGTPATVLHDHRAILNAPNIPGVKDKFATIYPADVPAAMENLAATINHIDTPSLTDREYFRHCARIFALFFLIHPYADGNGHIGRLMMHILAARRNIKINPAWTIHKCPYDYSISLGIQNYEHYPNILEELLRRWFGVWSAN